MLYMLMSRTCISHHNICLSEKCVYGWKVLFKVSKKTWLEWDLLSITETQLLFRFTIVPYFKRVLVAQRQFRCVCLKQDWWGPVCLDVTFGWQIQWAFLLKAIMFQQLDLFVKTVPPMFICIQTFLWTWICHIMSNELLNNNFIQIE